MSDKIIEALKAKNYERFRKHVFEAMKQRIPAALAERRKEVANAIFSKR